MTIAPPSIVLIVYGMANPIKFRPKIRIAPPMTPTMKNRVKMPMMVPTKMAGLPFAFTIKSVIALMLLISVC